MKRKAFTLVELMVAMGILALMLAMVGVIFKAAIRSHRMAVANAEVMSKFRLITRQLDSDFQGLRQDGEIFVAWVQGDHRQRFDRIMFYSIGDFQAYDDPTVKQGRLARITYMLGRRNGQAARNQNPSQRVLARTQHIYQWGATKPLKDLSTATVSDWFTWQNNPALQHDPNTMQDWLEIERKAKIRALWAIMDVNIVADVAAGGDPLGGGYGTLADPNEPNDLHAILCEGVGQFMIQSWYEDPTNPVKSRWIPDQLHLLDKAGLSDPDKIWGTPVRWVWYPYRFVKGVAQGEYHLDHADPGDSSYQPILFNDPELTPANFDHIPGLGRALKFTFTLYDSHGLLKHGRKFTYVVQLDE